MNAALFVLFSLVGVLIGYAIGAKGGRPKDSEAVALRLCGVVEDQAGVLRETTRQAVDAALVPKEDQLERVSNEHLAEVTAAQTGPLPNNYIGQQGPQDLDAIDGFDSYEIPTT